MKRSKKAVIFSFQVCSAYMYRRSIIMKHPKQLSLGALILQEAGAGAMLSFWLSILIFFCHDTLPHVDTATDFPRFPHCCRTALLVFGDAHVGHLLTGECCLDWLFPDSYR
jgi:hypothetical protein